mgnify:CR=1 FL=1
MDRKFVGLAICSCWIFLLLSGGCATEKNEDIVLSHQFELTKDQVEKNRQRAINGDAEAAFRLYEHYVWGLGDRVRGDNWLRRAAELGHEMARQHLSVDTENKKIDTSNVEALGPVPSPFE